MFNRLPYILRSQSMHSRQLALTTSFWYLEYVSSKMWELKIVFECIIISIINGSSRIKLTFEEIECVSSDRKVQSHYIQYSRKLHIPQTNQNTKTRIVYLTFLQLSCLCLAIVHFAHLAAAPGRRIVSAKFQQYTYVTLPKKRQYSLQAWQPNVGSLTTYCYLAI
jgi:hypothetical protein